MSWMKCKPLCPSINLVWFSKYPLIYPETWRHSPNSKSHQTSSIKSVQSYQPVLVSGWLFAALHVLYSTTTWRISVNLSLIHLSTAFVILKPMTVSLWVSIESRQCLCLIICYGWELETGILVSTQYLWRIQCINHHHWNEGQNWSNLVYIFFIN